MPISRNPPGYPVTPPGPGIVLMRIFMGGRLVSEVPLHPACLYPPTIPHPDSEPDVVPYNYSAWYNYWANRTRRERRC
jgi:hypothetical protein